LERAWLVAGPPSTDNDTLPVGVPAEELTATVTLAEAPARMVGALSVAVVEAAVTIRVSLPLLAAKFP